MSELLDALRERNIHRVVAEFSGSGDEGTVHDVTVTRRVQQVGSAGVVDADDELPHGDPLWDQIDRLCTEHADYDWWNNEGGHGTARIDVQMGTVTFDRNIYVETSEALDELTKAVP